MSECFRFFEVEDEDVKEEKNEEMEIDAPINHEKETRNTKKESGEARTNDATMIELDETSNDFKAKAAGDRNKTK